MSSTPLDFEIIGLGSLLNNRLTFFGSHTKFDFHTFGL